MPTARADRKDCDVKHLWGYVREEDMARVVELVSGVTACVLGLIGVLMEEQQIQSPLTNVSLEMMQGTGGRQGGIALSAMISDVENTLPVVALLLIGVALGAYLHAVRCHGAGLVLLWGCTIGLVIIGGYAAFAVPPYHSYWVGSYLQLLFLPVAIPVVTVTLAVISAFASWSAPHPVMSWPRHLFRHHRVKADPTS
jgi:hypothetical protein